MNEKIRELYISNGILDCLRDPYDALNNGANYSSIEVDLQRFAELIIQECLDICSAHRSCEGIADKIVADIKQHFGVEP